MSLITVTGLPRSGTAFVSMLLNLNELCVAYHELAAYDRNWRDRLIDYDSAYVADCNTYAYLENAKMPSAVRIYIKSDAMQSHRSAMLACKKKIDMGMINRFQQMANDWADRYEAFVISREDVFTIDGCRLIWQACFDEEFPETKVEQLIKLNVQHHNAHLKFGAGVKFEL